jgi:single-stranded-DNA-specific exonuclease
MPEKRWKLQDPITPTAQRALVKYPPALQQLLFNRGVTTEEEANLYLRAQTAENTDPYQMHGMSATVERIQHALQHNQAIAIYGDYDVDGVTATALLVTALRALGANVREYIPNRFDEGYGLNKEALTNLQQEGVRLVISVDCGIRSPAEADHARAIGLDLIITDHHEPAGDLPNALAIINPKQPACPYPEKYLAGVGIAYKIAQALHPQDPHSILPNLLEFVALGTVADLAPLSGENRALVRGGLRQMRQTANQGILSLAAVAQVVLNKITATNIGFALGPRLNASGRLESALASYNLLTTPDFMVAGQLAQQLDVQNRERQRLTREIQTQAEALALSMEGTPPILFAVDPGFNPGVVGLAAARLTESHYRPSVVGHSDSEETRASCRSIPEFHITKALDECADLLVRHGGHAAAAGFTVRNENLPELKERLTAIATRELGEKDLRATMLADAEVSLAELTPDLLKHIDYLEPTGYGNPGAVFISRGVRVVNARVVGADAKHLKLTVSQDNTTFDCIGFRLGEWATNTPAQVDLLYTFEANEWNGRTTLQLNLKDIKAA